MIMRLLRFYPLVHYHYVPTTRRRKLFISTLWAVFRAVVWLFRYDYMGVVQCMQYSFYWVLNQSLFPWPKHDSDRLGLGLAEAQVKHLSILRDQNGMRTLALSNLCSFIPSASPPIGLRWLPPSPLTWTRTWRTRCGFVYWKLEVNLMPRLPCLAYGYLSWLGSQVLVLER